MNVDTIVKGPLSNSCYLVSTENTAIVIDPGYRDNKIINFLKNNKDKERMILLTHAHFDHIGFADELRELTDTKIAIGRLDAPALSDPNLNLSGPFRVNLAPFEADILLDDNQVLEIGDLKFKIIFTPGHTVGGVCFYSGGILFSGDTLFFESVGRDDFVGGNRQDLIASVKRLLELPEKTLVFPGHHRETTILHERTHNPVSRGLL